MNDDVENNSNSLEQESAQGYKASYVVQDPTWWKWLLLGVASLMLCSLGPISVIAPFPLIMAFIIYGRAKGYVLGAICLGVISLLFLNFDISVFLFGLFILNFIYASLLSEVVFRKITPISGLIKVSGIVLLGLLFLIVAFVVLGDFSFDEYFRSVLVEKINQFKVENAELLSNGTQETKVLNDMIRNSDNVVNEIIPWLPAIFFVSVFLSVWLNLYMVLTNSRVWRKIIVYPYSLKHLLKFSVPDFLVFPLIISLALTLAGNYFLGDWATITGGNILYCFSIFYFFQGFGIYVDFLTHWKIFGFLRSILMVFTVFMAWRMLIIIGLFDLWFNFRKFLKKKEGDIE